MANATQIGDTKYIFGVDVDNKEQDSEHCGLAIRVESISKEEVPEFEAEAKDDNGNTASVVRGPSKFTFSVAGFVLSGKDLLCNRCKLTIPDKELGNCTGYVDKWSISSSNTEFKKCDLSVIYYPAATVCCP